MPKKKKEQAPIKPPLSELIKGMKPHWWRTLMIKGEIIGWVYKLDGKGWEVQANDGTDKLVIKQHAAVMRWIKGLGKKWEKDQNSLE